MVMGAGCGTAAATLGAVMTQRCGTCRWLDAPVVDGMRMIGEDGRYQCKAPLPDSILYINRVAMCPSNGHGCPVWAPLDAALPPQRPEYQGAKPLTNYAFAAYASRIAQKSADWAAGALQTIPEDVCDPIRARDAARFIAEIRGMLDHVEQQVGRS
jgi:hypothetical protein